MRVFSSDGVNDHNPRWNFREAREPSPTVLQDVMHNSSNMVFSIGAAAVTPHNKVFVCSRGAVVAGVTHGPT